LTREGFSCRDPDAWGAWGFLCSALPPRFRGPSRSWSSS
jgi:hypothetical protein